MEGKILQAKDLLKTKNIIRSYPEETLKQSLGKLSRSHDAAFVFTDNGNFLGAVSPYYTVFKSKYPSRTKVKRCLFNPPHITLNTYIWDIAKQMLEAKVYFLPVFENKNKFLGIVTVNRVFRAIDKNKKLANRILVQTKKEMITIQKNASLSETYNLMKDKQISRLPVIDKQGRLVGIVTRFDIREALAEPKQKPRFLSRVGEKEKYLNHSLEGYYKKIVVTASPGATGREILKKMLKNKVGSVVIINERNKPVGIVSSFDILRAIHNLRPKTKSELDLSIDEEFKETTRLERILSKFVSKINKFSPILKGEFILKADKNPSGKVREWTSKLQIVTRKGRKVIGKAKGFDWKKSVRKSVDKIKRQLQ